MRGIYTGKDAQKLVVSLDETSAKDKLISGGKASKLARLKQSGFLVPEGYVLTTKAFDKFTEVNSLTLNLLHKTNALKKNIVIPTELKLILKMISDKKIGTLIFRSSSVFEDSSDFSFAGMYESVPRVESYQELEEAVKKCYMSAFDRKVISYSLDAGLKSIPKLALLIQRFVNPDTAGVVFTVNPKSGDRSEVVINSVRGFAGKLLAGEQEGDEWICRKSGGALCLKEPQKSLKLNQVYLIRDTALKIEEQLGSPQDIEWVIENKKLYIVQSRPITNLPEPQESNYFSNMGERAELDLLDLNVQKPLNFSFMKEIMYNSITSINNIYGWSYVPNLRLINGYAYQQKYDPELDGEVPHEYSENLFYLKNLIPNKWKMLLKKVNKLTKEILSSTNQIKDLQDAYSHMEENWFKWKKMFDIHYIVTNSCLGAVNEFIYFINETTKQNYSPMQVYQILEGRGNYQARINDRIWKLSRILKNNPNALNALYNIRKSDEFLGLKISNSYKPFFDAFNQFVRKQGKIMYTLDISENCWEEDPLRLLHMIAAMARETRNNSRENFRNTQLARTKLLESIYKAIGNDTLSLNKFERLMAIAVECNKILQNRDVLILNPAFYSAHKFFLKIGDLLSKNQTISSNKDIFYLYPNEIKRGLFYTSINFLELVDRRKAELLFYSNLRAPSSIRKEEPYKSANEPESKIKVLKGVGVSPGKASGEVIIIKNFRERNDNPTKKRILVAHNFDLAWTPLFHFASGIITELDTGSLSHWTVIAREYGIPAIVGVNGILNEVKDHDIVEIDGDLGTVKIHKSRRARNKQDANSNLS